MATRNFQHHEGSSLGPANLQLEMIQSDSDWIDIQLKIEMGHQPEHPFPQPCLDSRPRTPAVQAIATARARARARDTGLAGWPTHWKSLGTGQLVLNACLSASGVHFMAQPSSAGPLLRAPRFLTLGAVCRKNKHACSTQWDPNTLAPPLGFNMGPIT